VFFIPDPRKLARVAPDVVLVLIAARSIMLFQNKAVTGSWTTLPEMLSSISYGVPAALTFQSNPVPHRDLTRETSARL